MMIGEAPGEQEDRQGLPFVGKAGAVLNGLIRQELGPLGWSRGDIYLTNLVKERPPGNRDPLPEEIERNAPELEAEIGACEPRLVVTLGRFSMARYFPGASISRIHGQARKVGNVIYYPMFHPAAALHQPRWRSLLEQDVARIPELLATVDEGQESLPEAPRAEQLSLF